MENFRHAASISHLSKEEFYLRTTSLEGDNCKLSLVKLATTLIVGMGPVDHEMVPNRCNSMKNLFFYLYQSCRHRKSVDLSPLSISP